MDARVDAGPVDAGPVDAGPTGTLDLDTIAQYRRDGYVVLRGMLPAGHVQACLDALSALAEDSALTAVPRGDAPFVALEAQADPAKDTVDRVRKFGDFTDASPALRRAAMSARLHAALDEIMGRGRVMLQEMALVKPPRIGGEKPWHQDAAYFRADDPGLVFGVWIALDPATEENGCMQVVPGSHRGGPVPHVPAEDINLCTIRPDHVRPEQAVKLPMQPGDALVFHSLIHHYTAANRSDLRRRALQFHYHQLGIEWTDIFGHRALYHDETGAYAGCTMPKGAPLQDSSSYLPRRLRPVQPD